MLKPFTIIYLFLFCFSSSQTKSFGVEYEEIIIDEIVDENEFNLINELVQLQERLYMKDIQEALGSGNIVTRRTNSKTHGCLEETFNVDNNLPKNISNLVYSTNY